MKTSFLKTDISIQSVLVIANVICFLACLFNTGFLVWIALLQFLGGIEQLFSSMIHMGLQHKSIGFVKWRHLHLWGSLLYLALLYPLSIMANNNEIFLVVIWAVIPQIIFYAYYVLCIKELHYLERREASILY